MRSTITTATAAHRLLPGTRPLPSRGIGSSDRGVSAVAMLAVPVMILAGVLTGPTALPVPDGDRQVIANAPLGGLPPAVAGKADIGNP
ncbi:hypothetical protein FNQ90_25540, partial [Streptomyces alkaliphilus]